MLMRFPRGSLRAQICRHPTLSLRLAEALHFPIQLIPFCFTAALVLQIVLEMKLSYTIYQSQKK